MTSWFW